MNKKPQNSPKYWKCVVVKEPPTGRYIILTKDLIESVTLLYHGGIISKHTAADYIHQIGVNVAVGGT